MKTAEEGLSWLCLRDFRTNLLRKSLEDLFCFRRYFETSPREDADLWIKHRPFNHSEFRFGNQDKEQQRGSVSALRTASLIHCHSNYHQWSPGFAIQPQHPGDWCLHALKCLWRYFWHSTADRLLIYWRFGSRIVGRRNINLSNLPLLIGRKRLSRPRRWEALSGRRLGQQNKWCVLNAPITAETFRCTMNLTWLYADEGGPLLLLLKCWRNECVQPWGLSGILMSHS